MNTAMDNFHNDPKFKEVVNGVYKGIYEQDEIGKLNRKHTQPVHDQFETSKKERVDEARKLVDEYTIKMEEEVNAKFSKEINRLKSELVPINKDIASKEKELSSQSEDLSKLSKKIRRLKELKEAQK